MVICSAKGRINSFGKPQIFNCRWLLLGKNLNEQMLLVVHTFRYDDVVRIISARKATATEAATYMKRLTK